MPNADTWPFGPLDEDQIQELTKPNTIPPQSFMYYTYCAKCGERIYFNTDDAPKYCEYCEAKKYDLKDTTD